MSVLGRGVVGRALWDGRREVMRTDSNRGVRVDGRGGRGRRELAVGVFPLFSRICGRIALQRRLS